MADWSPVSSIGIGGCGVTARVRWSDTVPQRMLRTVLRSAAIVMCLGLVAGVIVLAWLLVQQWMFQ
jgi:hypothetical protein